MKIDIVKIARSIKDGQPFYIPDQNPMKPGRLASWEELTPQAQEKFILHLSNEINRIDSEIARLQSILKEKEGKKNAFKTY
jgi:hypothetical protein